jgi:hypothetical protein
LADSLISLVVHVLIVHPLGAVAAQGLVEKLL